METPPLNQLSDAELIRAYREGDEDALAILIRRHIGSVYRFLYRMANDAQTAEDLTQETFIKVWKHLPRFDPSKTFKTWTFSIAKNSAIDYFRKKNPSLVKAESADAADPLESVPDAQPLPDELLERKETAAYLDEALSALPPRTRSIVLMHETEDMTFQEIADATGEPMNTVKSRYRRALATLKERLMARFTREA